MPSFEGRAAYAVLWSTLEILARYGAQFVVTVVLARLLSPSDFGLIAILLAFTSVAAVFVDSGFGIALIQRQHTTEDDEATVFVFGLYVGILTAVALVVAAPSIAGFFGQPSLIGLTRLVAFVLPLGALGAVPDALLTKKLDFRSRARAEIVASLCSGAAAITLAMLGLGVWSLAWQTLIATSLRTLLLWRYSHWRPHGRYRKDAFDNLFRFGGYMLLSRLLDTAFVRLQSLLIGKLFDPRALGYYTLAQNTQQAPASFLDGILNRVGLPMLAAVAADRDKLVSAMRTSLRIAMFLFVPCMVGIAIVAKPLIDMLYGARWISAAPILSILALGTASWPLHILNLSAINALGRSDLFFRLEVVKKLVAIGLIVAASPCGGIAIAWAVFGTSILGVFINTHYPKKLLGYGITEQLSDQVATFILSVIAAAVGWALLHWMPICPISMLLAVTASAFIYFGLAAVTKNQALLDLLALARAMRTKTSAAHS